MQVIKHYVVCIVIEHAGAPHQTVCVVFLMRPVSRKYGIGSIAINCPGLSATGDYGRSTRGGRHFKCICSYRRADNIVWSRICQTTKCHSSKIYDGIIVESVGSPHHHPWHSSTRYADRNYRVAWVV